MRNVKSFIFFVAIFIAPIILLAQATVSHGFKQDIEISADGKGGPTLIKQGETKIISYLPKSGNVSIRVRYKEGRRFVEKIANVNVSNGKLFLPEAPNAAVVQASVTQQTNKVQTQKPDQNSTTGDYNPKVGEVNIIKKLNTTIDSFPIKVVNKSGKGDLIFVGSVFTGAAIGERDTLTSTQNVRPGFLELNVIYKEAVYESDDAIGQSFIIAQQSLIFMVTDPNQIIEIDGSQFFDFSDLAPNMKVRFKNVGSITLFSRPVSRPLRSGRMSKSYKYEDAHKITWHFSDKDNLQRVTVWNYVPDSRLIKIRAIDDIFGVGR